MVWRAAALRLRHGLEAHATEIWANDADPDRLPLLQRTLAPGGALCHHDPKTAVQCAAVEQRFDFVDLDAFGAPMALVPWALEAVRLAASFISPAPMAAPSLAMTAPRHCGVWAAGAALQLGVGFAVAVGRHRPQRLALGRGIRPLLSFSDGRTFRTAVQVLRSPAPAEEQLGAAGPHSCGPTAALLAALARA